jgi:hypothetical protein
MEFMDGISCFEGSVHFVRSFGRSHSSSRHGKRLILSTFSSVENASSCDVGRIRVRSGVSGSWKRGSTRSNTKDNGQQ